MRHSFLLLLIAGLILMLVAELGGLVQLRLPAVLLLIAGAAGMGVQAGGALPRRLAAPAAGLVRTLASLIAILLLAPTLVALALVVLQAPMQFLLPAVFTSPDANPGLNGGWRIAGSVTALLLLAAAMTALAVALRAIRAESPEKESGKAP